MKSDFARYYDLFIKYGLYVTANNLKQPFFFFHKSATSHVGLTHSGRARRVPGRINMMRLKAMLRRRFGDQVTLGGIDGVEG